MNCKTSGCDRRARKREYCNTHYERARLAGEFGGKPCSIAECQAPLYALDMCSRHYKQARRKLTPAIRDRLERRSQGMRRCPYCGQIKPLTDFAPRTRDAKNQVLSYCAECRPKRAREMRGARRARSYGLSPSELTALQTRQGSRCAICGLKESVSTSPTGLPSQLAIDHDHRDGSVRGLLCGTCNRGIGALRDDPVIIGSALAYLRDPPANLLNLMPGQRAARARLSGDDWRSRRSENRQLEASDRRRCRQCNLVLPLSQFYKAGSQGYQGACRSCYNSTMRARFLQDNFGIDAEQYLELLSLQGGGCAICQVAAPSSSRRTAAFAVDHDHSTGRVRGLLCAQCNTGLGLLRDHPEMLERALTYLANPPARELLV